ncbi:ExbD/TolR family protein [Marinobacterium mangrovicola]|uniref:Outer membrane transport energization protein ExbD n=1 Tax=Marinobacterium mangrovicola TaxID=1476959 RepID=A0A4V2PCV0_9GAMM|nr:biopolymer transporter ExbD [Marinobacterium mangrovicola]TCK02676.1 outer membrane transport energization protein ExbD [Marinobacterium mangrovicola]
MLLDVGTNRKPAKISLTPLIDVVFILLLFFMLTSSFMQWRQMDLPIPTASDKPAEESEVITVRLLSNGGDVRIEDNTFNILANGVPAELMGDAEPLIAIEAEEGVSTQALVQLVDKLRLAGAEKVSLAGVLQ